VIVISAADWEGEGGGRELARAQEKIGRCEVDEETRGVNIT